MYLFNKDCKEVLKDIPNASIDCVLTDPPYSISFRSSRRQVRYQYIANDSNLSWLPETLKEFKRIMKPDAHAYIFCGRQTLNEVLNITSVILPIRNLLIWKKNNWGMGDLKGDYAPQYEMILFISNGKKKLNGKRHSNILEYAKTGNKLHPTQKPTDLIEFLIEKSTNEGDTVLDPFMGSGTTAEACMNTNRNFIGCEIDKAYYTTTLERINKLENADIA